MGKNVRHIIIYQWDNVIWSDETKIYLLNSVGVKCFRRRRRNFHPNTLPLPLNNQLVLIWGCMTSKFCGQNLFD